MKKYIFVILAIFLISFIASAGLTPPEEVKNNVSISTYQDPCQSKSCAVGERKYTDGSRCLCVTLATHPLTQEEINKKNKEAYLWKESQKCIATNNCWDAKTNYCFKEGDRFFGKYCGIGAYSSEGISKFGTWEQRKEQDYCQTNFSCASNLCQDNLCVDDSFDISSEKDICSSRGSCFVKDFEYKISCLVFSEKEVYLNTSCAEITFNFSLNFLNGTGICINLGQKNNDFYCGVKKNNKSNFDEFQLSPIKQENASCVDNFECQSNFCYKNICQENGPTEESLKLKEEINQLKKEVQEIKGANSSSEDKEGFFYRYFWRFFK